MERTHQISKSKCADNRIGLMATDRRGQQTIEGLANTPNGCRETSATRPNQGLRQSLTQTVETLVRCFFSRHVLSTSA